MLLSLCHTWDLNLQYSDPESMRRVAIPLGDLLDDLLAHCAGTLRTTAFTMYKTGVYLSQLVVLYFPGSW